MVGVKKNVLAVFVVMALLTSLSAYAQSENRFLEPEVIDNAFDACIGKTIESIVGSGRLGIERIDGYDDFLDRFSELSPFDFELGFTLANIYLWRGQTLGSDTSWMPYVTVSPDFEPLGDISFTYWVDITKDTPGKDDLEYDFVIDYTVSMLELACLIGFKKENAPYLLEKALDFSFSTGYIYYWFPPAGDDSYEMYWGVEYNLPFHPTMTIYNDFGDGSGVWLEWGVSQDFDLKLVTLSTFATLGYNHRQWGKTSALSVFQFGGSIPLSIGTHMTIEPFLSYSARLKKTFDDDGANLTHDAWYGGFNFSIGF